MKITQRRSPPLAAIYVRVSTTVQEEEGTSLATQEAACRSFAQERGYTVSEGHFYREVHTGVELWTRPELTRLREAMRRGEVDFVVAYAIDRLSRDPTHLGVLISEADHYGVEVFFVTEALDNTPEGQLIRFVRGYAAKVEHEKIRERCIRGRYARVKEGKIHNHAHELYGYRRDKERGVRIILPEEAAVVRRIYEHVADRQSIRSLCKQLNDEGISPPSVGKFTFKKNPRTPFWGHGVISRILHEPAYKGETVLWRWKSQGPNKYPEIRPEEEWLRLPDGVTPAIVSPSLWEIVQERLRTNKGERTRNMDKARQYLLRGLVKCAVCGRSLWANPERNIRVYRCSSRETPQGPCGGKRVPADPIEDWVWSQIYSLLTDPGIIEREVERQRSAGPDPGLVAELNSARQDIVRLEKQQERLVSAFKLSEDLPIDLFQREIAGVQKQKMTLQDRMKVLEERLQEKEQVSLSTLTEYCQRVRSNLEAFTFEEKRFALEALAIQVTANGNGKQEEAVWKMEGNIPIEEDVGVSSTTCCSRGRRGPARRCSPGGCRGSCRRSPWRRPWR